jgi:hypothetical protein
VNGIGGHPSHIRKALSKASRNVVLAFIYFL